MPLQMGDIILNGKYTIQRLLGRGSYGNVWLAVDHLSGGRRVAIKELRQDEVTPEQFADGVKRFEREALIGTQPRHPHIVKVYTVEQVGPDRLLVLEYVDGESLRQRLDREGALPVDEAVRITVESCRALEAVRQHTQM